MEEVDNRLRVQRTSKSLSGSNDVPGRWDKLCAKAENWKWALLV